MFKNPAEEQKKVPRTTKMLDYGCFDLFPVQANKQSVLLATGRKVLCMQIPSVIF